MKSTRSQQWSPNLPLQLPDPTNSTCSMDLSSADHEAIRYFRTTFAKIYHTKNPDYSLFSIIFNIAEREPMVMRAVLALGGQEVEFRRRSALSQAAVANLRQPVPPLHHYSSALRMMADTFGRTYADGSRQFDLDSILAALYLMILYEKKYGDGKCFGLSNHLAGASQVVQHHFRTYPPRVTMNGGNGNANNVALLRTCQSQQEKSAVLSLFSARLLVYLAVQDSFASTFGIGGQLVAALNDSNLLCLDGPESLHRFSYPLYCTMWAENYPQAELLDDLENRSIFALGTATAHLRFMVAQMRSLDNESAPYRIAKVQTAIQLVGFRFKEILAVADELSMATDSSHRLVASIRAIVPQFYSVQIEFRRAKRYLGLHDRLPSDHLIRAIMNLALQSFKHQGDEAVIRIVWPLYNVALEAGNSAHRDWILARLHGISSYGKNYERAYQFLVRSPKLQDMQTCGRPESVMSQSAENVDVAGLFVL